jgi:hypothetical protein
MFREKVNFLKLRSVQRLLVYRAVTIICLLTIVTGGIIIGLFVGHLSRAQLNNALAIAGCSVFPADNIWNRDISNLPAHPNSANFIASIGATGSLVAAFRSGLGNNGAPIGMPYIVVPGSQPEVPVRFYYAHESDPGPYPIPPNAPIENGPDSSGDRHVIVIDSSTCKVYEMFASYPQPDGSWKAASGAVWNLNSDALRPSGYTSADAAGLPIFPGLARYDEVAGGAINHALRLIVNNTQQAYIWPARHYASTNTNPDLPPMGLRLRLKASVDISSFPLQSRIILTALKKYGMFVADNGGNNKSWSISGAPDNGWNYPDLLQLSRIQGLDFEAVDESSLQVSIDSGQAKVFSQSGRPTSTAKPIKKTTSTPTSPTNSLTLAPLPTPTPAIIQENNGNKKGMNAPFLFLLGGLGILLVLIGVGWQRFVRKRNKYLNNGEDIS